MFKRTLFSLSLAMLIFGQIYAQGASFGPQVGYQKARDADKGNVIGGAALRIKLNPVIGLEGAINYRQEKYANEALTVRSWPIMLTGLIYPTSIIYGAIGFGWYNTSFDYNQNLSGYQAIEDKTIQKVGWHFGAGVDLPVGPASNFTADIRYVFLNYNFSEIPGSGELNSNFYVVTVGYLVAL